MTNRLYLRRAELFGFLYEICKEDHCVLGDTLNHYISLLDDVELLELEDFLVNNFGDN